MEILFNSEDSVKASAVLIDSNNGVDTYRIELDWEKETVPQPVNMKFANRCFDMHSHWSPVLRTQKHIPWISSKAFESRLAYWMPLEQFTSKSGNNRLTIAVSDVKTPIRIASGVGMPSFNIETEITFFTSLINPVSHYETLLRIDKRDISFSDAIMQSAKWYSSLGYKNNHIPDSAFDSVYSSWYAYMQDVRYKDILKECRLAKRAGMDTLILDDGWQNKEIVRDYSTCGDWTPARNRFPDMRRFVDTVHGIGMKVMLWFSVPFMGWDAKNFSEFEGKYLYSIDKARCSVLDPRYKEVRDFLVSTFANAVRDWDLDGLKLDFIDRFKSDGKITPEMDFSSVEDAVETLLDEITSALRRIKSDILIEFRQPYIGPVISTYGNMIRVWDCPEDALTNRLSITDLRLVTTDIAVHSDMIVWSDGDSDESVATHLYSSIFSVPQISVKMYELSESHRQVLKSFLSFRNKNKDVLMKGKFSVKGIDCNYSYTESVLGDKRVALFTDAPIIKLSADISEYYVINLSGGNELFVTGDTENVKYEITDCLGKKICRLKKLSKSTRTITVPNASIIRFIR